MTPEQFMMAVEALQAQSVIPPGHGWKTALANKLGVTRTTIDNFERQGTRQVQTDYAISALLAGLEPYPTNSEALCKIGLETEAKKEQGE